jgi:hypothetical protein
MGKHFPIHTLTILKAAVGVSLVCLISAMFIPQFASFRDFLTGAAVGMLIPAFFSLFSLQSVTTKDEMRDAESDIQTLRLS